MKVVAIVSMLACALLVTANLAQGATITLSDQGLIALDSNLQWAYTQPRTATIQEARNVPGPGVEFDIHFLDTQNSSDSSILWMSDDRQGSGTLAGWDVSGFGLYELCFTLLAVNGDSSPGTGGELMVGAAIGGGGITYKYAPLRLSLDPGTGHPQAGISSTPFDFDIIDRIGFRAWLRSGWDPGPTTITLRVEAVPGAYPIPEPASLSLLAIGVPFALGRGKQRWRYLCRSRAYRS